MGLAKPRALARTIKQGKVRRRVGFRLYFGAAMIISGTVTLIISYFL